MRSRHARHERLSDSCKSHLRDLRVVIFQLRHFTEITVMMKLVSQFSPRGRFVGVDSESVERRVADRTELDSDPPE